MPRFLTLTEVLLILQDQIRRYGGAFGVRDLSLLSSALAMPESTFGGKYLHKDVFQQAAAYSYHIYENHPFVDGNKRVALAAALVFLDLNGIEIDDPEEHLYDLMMKVAKGKSNKDEISKTLKAHSKKKRR
jgi:death on curing protein